MVNVLLVHVKCLTYEHNNHFSTSFEGTIFAYGQTGAGKTFKMQGPDMASSDYREHCGLVPRSMDYIFQRIQQLEEESCGAKKITARCSFLEIYMENVTLRLANLYMEILILFVMQSMKFTKEIFQ